MAPHHDPPALAASVLVLFTQQPKHQTDTPYHIANLPRYCTSSREPHNSATPILTMTTFEPSLSTTMRASSHDAPSTADQLPSINFGFDDLRSRMNQFTSRFDAFIENGRRRVLEERNQFRMNVAELHGMFTYTLKGSIRRLTTTKRTNE